MTITFRYGQPPNLPWWRIQNMSDEEIKKFNDGFMKEEKVMTDPIGACACIGPQKGETLCPCDLKRKTNESVGINKTIGHPSVDISVLHKEIWNEAIEAAEKEVYASNGPAWLAVNIRRLKK